MPWRERLAGVGGRHAFIFIVRRNPGDQLALAWLTGHQGLRSIDVGRCPSETVETQIGIASFVVRSVAGKATRHQDRADIPIERNFVSRRDRAGNERCTPRQQDDSTTHGNPLVSFQHASPSRRGNKSREEIALGVVSKHQPRRASVRFQGRYAAREPWASAQRLMRTTHPRCFETEPSITEVTAAGAYRISAGRRHIFTPPLYLCASATYCSTIRLLPRLGILLLPP